MAAMMVILSYPSDADSFGHVRGRVVSTVRVSDGTAVIDLPSPSVAGLGVTGELAAGNDCRLSAAWAEAFGAAGSDGLWYLPRFTPRARARPALLAASGTSPGRPVVQSAASCPGDPSPGLRARRAASGWRATP